MQKKSENGNSMNFAELDATQARRELGIAENECVYGIADDGLLEERDTPPFPVEKGSQHVEARVANNLRARFDEKCLNNNEVGELFDRVFSSRREEVEAEECQWEKWWKELVCKQVAPKLLTPGGEAGKIVVKLFAEELAKGNKEVEVPDARYLVCTMVVLQKAKKKMTSQGIKMMMLDRVQQWREGRYSELVTQALENEKQFAKSGYKTPPKDEAAILRQASMMFSKNMKAGDIGKAMRWGMGNGHEQTRVFQPNDTILTKNGRQRVADILAEKYPAPAPVHREAVEEIYECENVTMPAIFDVTPEEVERHASTLKGCAGPSGVDAANLGRMLSAHGEESREFREAFVERAHLLTRQQLPWEKVRTSRACKQIALGTQVGVCEVTGEPVYKLRPVGVGEAGTRMLVRIVVSKTRDEYIEACGVWNVCTGVRAGAEGIVHTLQQAVHEAERIGGGEEPEVMVKMDASDAFNNLSRSVALLHAGIKCPKSRCFVLNSYRGSPMMIARGTSGALICHSEEGVIQGCPFSGLLYGVGSLPLLKKIHHTLLPPPETRSSIGVGIGLLNSVPTVDEADAYEGVDADQFEFTLRFDGGANAAKGARGAGTNSKVPVGAGAVLFRGGVEQRHKVYERAIFLPEATVNDGEYTGAIAGLEACAKLGVKKVLVQGDSSLVLDQLSGRATVREPHLATHYTAAAQLLRAFPPGGVVFDKIRRDDNRCADKLTHTAREQQACHERFYPIIGNPTNNSPDYLLEARGERNNRLDLQGLAGHSRMVRPMIAAATPEQRREASDTGESQERSQQRNQGGETGGRQRRRRQQHRHRRAAQECAGAQSNAPSPTTYPALGHCRRCWTGPNSPSSSPPRTASGSTRPRQASHRATPSGQQKSNGE